MKECEELPELEPDSRWVWERKGPRQTNLNVASIYFSKATFLPRIIYVYHTIGREVAAVVGAAAVSVASLAAAAAALAAMAAVVAEAAAVAAAAVVVAAVATAVAAVEVADGAADAVKRRPFPSCDIERMCSSRALSCFHFALFHLLSSPFSSHTVFHASKHLPCPPPFFSFLTGI
jgi:hypothetical protein